MGTQEQQVYIGIDFNQRFTQISYFRPGMKEPETVSTVVGEERYRISTVQYQGREARETLLAFFRRVIRMVPKVTEFSEIAAVTIHLNPIDLALVRTLRSILMELGISREGIFILDSKKSFCHYVMHQKKELMQYDVALFACEEDELSCLYLEKKEKTRPITVTIREIPLGKLPKEPRERDLYFSEKAGEILSGTIISAVYLIGDGLEGGWLSESLSVLCRGRKAFQGKNLYTAGACHNSFMQMHKETRSYIYFGENQLSHNLYLQVKQGGRTFFKELAEAGTSYHEVEKSCEVLLDGDPSVDVWIQAPDSSKARIESLELTDLPARPPKATRLKIEALPGETGRVMVRISDLGFGPWYKSSGKVWEYGIDE